MNKTLLQLLQQTLDALTTAVKQNQHDMLMTGHECRAGETAISALQAAIAQPADQFADAGKAITCVWTEQDDDHMPGTYTSACGEMWSFIDGGVAENNVRFCHGCGKPVEVHSIKAEG